MFQDSAAIPHVINGLIIQPLHAVPLVLVNIGGARRIRLSRRRNRVGADPRQPHRRRAIRAAVAPRISRRARRHRAGHHSHRGNARIDQGGQGVRPRSLRERALRARQLGIVHGGAPCANAVRQSIASSSAHAIAGVRRRRFISAHCRYFMAAWRARSARHSRSGVFQGALWIFRRRARACAT